MLRIVSVTAAYLFFSPRSCSLARFVGVRSGLHSRARSPTRSLFGQRETTRERRDFEGGVEGGMRTCFAQLMRGVRTNHGGLVRDAFTCVAKGWESLRRSCERRVRDLRSLLKECAIRSRNARRKQFTCNVMREKNNLETTQ